MDVLLINIWGGWVGILLGMLAGAVQGLWFHRPDWMGGYGSWRRRLTRLGHISFFGLALINLLFALSSDYLIRTFSLSPAGLIVPACLLVAGAALMPAICYLAAWRERWQLMFCLPVGCLIAGVGSFLAWGAFQ